MAVQTMDKLSLWAAEARRLGMRYGDYVAKYHPAVPDPQRTAKRKPDPAPAFGRQKRMSCQFCGGGISPDSRRRLYCSEACAMSAHEEQKMRRYKKSREGALHRLPKEER